MNDLFAMNSGNEASAALAREDSDLHNGHRSRLRERILRDGLDGVAPHELLEFLLYYSQPRQDMNQLAHRLLDHFGSLTAVFSADLPSLMQVEGMGEPSARWLCMFQENLRACTANADRGGIILKNFTNVFRYALSRRDHYPPPQGVQLCLDRDGQLLYESAFSASPRWGEVDSLRSLVDDAISSEARNVILLLYTHQHTPVASYYDIAHARSYAQLMHVANCTLLDVVLVGRKQLCSMRQCDTIDLQSGAQRAFASLREDYLRGMPVQPLFDAADYQTGEPLLHQEEEDYESI